MAGDRRTPGRSYWRRAVLLAPPATLYSLLPPLFLRVQKFVMGLAMFWDFGSLYQGSAGVPVASCCGSGKSSDVAASSLLTVAAAARVPVHAVSGGTRKYLFISSSLHRPFGGCFLLHAAKLVEVGRNIAVLSLGEGSCDDDLRDQAPKLVKFVDTAVVPSLAMDGVTTRRELLGSFVG